LTLDEYEPWAASSPFDLWHGHHPLWSKNIGFMDLIVFRADLFQESMNTRQKLSAISFKLSAKPDTVWRYQFTSISALSSATMTRSRLQSDFINGLLMWATPRGVPAYTRLAHYTAIPISRMAALLGAVRESPAKRRLTARRPRNVVSDC